MTSIELDSRRVEPGALFCCLPGRSHDGHDFAADAIGLGAVGLLVERPLPLAVTQALVTRASARQVMAQVSRTFYGDPARSMVTVGVTGTNGKTTVTHLLASIFEAHGVPCAVIGTLDGARTTPESPILHRLLAEARDAGCGALSMEVSSHALTEERVDGIRFSAAVFTNLSHDHLDHHGTMEAYFAAKASLLTSERAALGVVNADDPWGARLLAEGAIPMVPFSISDADNVIADSRRTAFTWRRRRIELALRGSYHVANALAAATTAAALGLPDEVIATGLAAAAPIAGRFEIVGGVARFTVVVDYAHTPDGLRVALDSARGLAAGRVVCVFGCGGDRDHAKRPLMGAVSAMGADVVVVTSDNPRGEDPAAIIEAIVAGIGGGAEVIVEPDRRAAIALAVDLARPGDVVLVAGKGHETAMEVAGRRIPFDDRVEASSALTRVTEGGSGR
ncbi:MAG: UDP-N-acetylmuramoyl-L-alanyl-D-glutamate--2,6-diaminopimelate ligase [Acidimicrobiales bacterium]